MQVYGLMTEFLKKADDKNRKFVKFSIFYTLDPIRYRKAPTNKSKKFMKEKLKKAEIGENQ